MVVQTEMPNRTSCPGCSRRSRDKPDIVAGFWVGERRGNPNIVSGIEQGRSGESRTSCPG
jgi:hypothetical protein